MPPDMASNTSGLRISSPIAMTKSSAVSGCDGSYSLPVVDGSWSVNLEADEIAAAYGDYSTASASRLITLPGDDPDDNDFIIGPSRVVPHIVGIEPADA